MVVASPTPIRGVEKTKPVGIPIIDLSRKRSQVTELIVKACEEFGFFKVINHGISNQIITKMEREAVDFFAKSLSSKHGVGPANPFGYGSKTIGFNGDEGEVEYLILQSNPISISHKSKAISNDPTKFSCALNDYIQAVRNLACEILELMAEGLWVPDKSVFSRFIRDVDSDSVIRLNHYPSRIDSKDCDKSPSFHHPQQQHSNNNNRIGFGEHSDPQILTILRSNDVDGLQISLEDGVWVPIPADPTSLCVNVGDVLQALTNGRFMSVRHRVLANSLKSRMSMMYFGAPPFHARISPIPEMVTAQKPCLYRPFTWREYKKATYSLRLGDHRLDLFRNDVSDDNGNVVDIA